MNKKDAADFLSISARALEYHVTQGHIGRRMVPGKTGGMADFDEGELRGLEAKLDAKRRPRPTVAREGDESPEGEARSLARLSDAPPALLDLLARLAASMKSARQLPPAERPEPSIAGLAAKPLLTLDECRALTVCRALICAGP